MTIVNLLTTGSVMIFVWNVDRPGPGLNRMAWGDLLVGFGLLIGAFRPTMPKEVAILGSNLAVFAGAILLLSGVRAFRGLRPMPPTLVTAMCCAYTGGLMFWLLADEKMAARVILTCFSLGILTFAMAVAMVVDLPKEDRRLYVFSGTLFCLHTVSLALRAGWAVRHMSGTYSLANATPDITSMFTLNFVVTGCCLAIATASSRKLYHSTRRLALHDPLTQLPNRRMFEERISELCCAGSKPNTALIYLDLDNFKLINDTFGHSWGDQVLRVVGERLANEFVGNGFPARLGGDEFVVLMEGVGSRTAAFQMMERVIRTIQTDIVVGQQTVCLDVRGGLALYPEDVQSLNELTNVADRCMYRSKRRHHRFPPIQDSIPAPSFSPSPKTLV